MTTMAPESGAAMGSGGQDGRLQAPPDPSQPAACAPRGGKEAALAARRRAREEQLRRQQEQEPEQEQEQQSEGSAKEIKCAACKRSKVRCDLKYPCSRCWKLSRQCRPMDLYEREAAMSTPELVMDTNDLAPVGEAFCRVLTEALDEGGIDRGKALRLIRMWRRQSTRAGADVSHGAKECLRAGLNVSQAEAALHLDGELDDKELQAPGPAHADALRQAQDRGLGRGVLVDVLEDLPGGGGGGGRGHARRQLATDGAFAGILLDAQALQEASLARGACPLLLLAAFVYPGDRDAYFRGVVHGLLAPDSRTDMCSFVKLIDREGQIQLHFLRTATLSFPATEEGDGPRRHGMGLWLEPAPPSRYVTDRPGALVSRCHYYQPPKKDGAAATAPSSAREDKGSAEAAEAAAAAPAAAPFYLVPGLTGLPMQVTPMHDGKAMALAVQQEVCSGRLFAVSSSNHMALLSGDPQYGADTGKGSKRRRRHLTYRRRRPRSLDESSCASSLLTAHAAAKVEQDQDETEENEGRGSSHDGGSSYNDEEDDLLSVDPELLPSPKGLMWVKQEFSSGAWSPLPVSGGAPVPASFAAAPWTYAMRHQQEQQRHLQQEAAFAQQQQHQQLAFVHQQHQHQHQQGAPSTTVSASNTLPAPDMTWWKEVASILTVRKEEDEE